MGATVAIPIWLLVLILAFAAVTFASHFLFPSVRWFLRRRMERVVAELNKRLDHPIQPFKLARRSDMIQRIIYDSAVVEAVAEHAAETGVREDVAFETAKRYAREIVPSFSATTYFGFATRAAKTLSTWLYDVQIAPEGRETLSDIDPDATLVFVMNHRSNMDYVLVTYLAAQQSALSYAVGEWARVWPIQGIIRGTGAYFIRRGRSNYLYRRVLSRYVQLSTAAGVAQAVFPEGGLSLDGTIGEPKLGILSYIISGFDPDARDVVFVPVALNYDRVIEDRVLVAADRAGHRRFRASKLEAMRFTLRYLWARLRGRTGRFGEAAVTVAPPLSLRAMAAETPEGLTAAVAEDLMTRIRAAVPVPMMPVLAEALLDGVEEGALADEVADRARRLAENGARLTFRPEEVEGRLGPMLAQLRRRRLIGPPGDVRPLPEAIPLLRYYVNSAGHPLPQPAVEAPPERQPVDAT